MEQNKKRGRRRGGWLLLVGIGLIIYALIGLWRAPSVAQYMAIAPAEVLPDGDGSGGTRALLDRYEAWLEGKLELGADAKAGIAATAYDTAVVAGAAQSAVTTITCTDEGWFLAHPKYLIAGRLYGAADIKAGAKVAVLDEQLAFELFPTTEPTEGRVEIGGEWYEVIGVVRHTRGAGDIDEHAAYIPITTAARARMQTDFVQIDCALDIPGAARAVESVGADVLGSDGNFYDIDKEVMRATMIARVIAVLFALYLIGQFVGRWNARTRTLVIGWQAEVKQRYFKKMLPGVIGRSLLQIAGYALFAAAAYAVLTLTIAPMYVFTEWIPEVIVEWSKIYGRARELMVAAAAPLALRTRAFAAVRFYGALFRWGVVCLLAGGLLVRRRSARV
ncbi:MAG: ABC transporter permease [Christensenellales bacterium]|jgi:hypothetical protein